MNEKKEANEICAKFVGPAPNNYRLPPTVGAEQHDITKPQAPSFSIRRNTMKFNDQSPGPIYGYSSNLTNHGLSSVPSQKMPGRAKVPFLWEGIQDNPAPGKYCGNKVRVLRERTAPAFSFTSRPKTVKNSVPSPCTYSLPAILGDRPINMSSVPLYSMNKRLDYSNYAYDFAKTPGPARYQVPPLYASYKRPPIFSLKSRTIIPKFKMNNPGPGTYESHIAKPLGKSTPKYSMGIKHSQYLMPMFMDVFD